ncbi:hypothetical protein CARUB_v10006689mg [Capsella rubella]|uniref:F-box domain-containing protein n=1 Tax=Capsella rubella TaxID=81985 RepID=R0H0R1_9BRAS|nr:F-box protein At3g26010 [Capsella rubella]EOA18205.1 hypothetical protein CARUB_v10006689mg [Capsella rubella]
MEAQTNTAGLPEVMLTEILAKLPMRSISRFKSVCKTWKKTLESVYFRRHFMSLHQHSSSSCSWSLIRGEFMGKELMGCYGQWDLPKSPASYIPPPSKYFSSSFSNGLVLMEGRDYFFFVGNPVLRQWAKIPYPLCDTSSFGLVSRVDLDGVVVSFKIVRRGVGSSNTDLFVRIYSSETGVWTSKQLHFPCDDHIPYSSPISLNETIYFLAQTDFHIRQPGVLIAHDFYSESDQCQVIPLPDHSNNPNYKRALTTCGGFVMYVKTLAENVYDSLKVWRLRKDSAAWELLWDLDLPLAWADDIAYNAPVAMHPFDSDVVYIWRQKSRDMVSYNLRTQNYTTMRDASKWYNDNNQNSFMNRFVCQKYMDEIYGPNSLWGSGSVVALFQFVQSRWMEPVPCPPQVEMINTASLLSYISSIKKRKRDIGRGFRY